MRGVLNVNKPSGMTSYDVIRRLKTVLGPDAPPLGHAGTLDPLAAGVLLILVGEATKISRFLAGSAKEYEAELLFGIRTDTDDVSGTAIAESPVPDMSEEKIRSLLAGFTGPIQQIPPAFSALKRNGVPLYRLARKGIKVQPEPRSVTVHKLELIEWNPPRVRFLAAVSAGTYIRALARDLGQAAGTNATLAGLTRTRSGRFTLEQAVPLRQLILDPKAPERIVENLVPIEQALPDLPRFTVSPELARRLLQGQTIRNPEAPPAEYVLAVTADRKFLALVAVREDAVKPVRIIHAD